jgi:hypothetical protein
MESIMTPSGPVALLARNLCHVSWTKADRWRASVLFAAYSADRSEEEALKDVYKQIILEQNVGYHYC